MNKLPVKKSFLEITSSEVYAELQSQNYIDKIYKKMITRLKETCPYKRMQEVAVQHMYDILVDHSLTGPCSENKQEKKRQIAEIGLLALSIDSSISEVLTETLKEDARSVVEHTIKKLESKNSGISEIPSPSAKGIKRSASVSEERDEKISNKDKESFKRFRNTVAEDSEGDSDDPAVNLSIASVSSVHTSDLSSFDDDLVLSSEDESNGKKVKTLSFKAVNEVYNSMVSAKKIKPLMHPTRVPLSKASSNKSVGSGNDASHKVLPKRIRKPNAKYASED